MITQNSVLPKQIYCASILVLSKLVLYFRVPVSFFGIFETQCCQFNSKHNLSN